MSLIQSVLIFYPLIIPVWESGPFDNDNIKPPKSLPFENDTKVAFQISSFKKIIDPRIRSKIAIELINSNNPTAVDGLTDIYINNSKNIPIKADILNALYKLKNIKKCSNNTMLKKCMTNSNESIRVYSAGLYFANSKDSKTILNLLKNERSLFVKNLLWGDLKKSPESCTIESLKTLLTSQDYTNRAGATNISAMIVKKPDLHKELNKCASDNDIIVRTSLASALASRKSGGSQLLSKLATDKAVQVRTIVASANPTPNREDIQIALTKDKDPEVRRIAIHSLRHYQNKKSYNAILNTLNDPFKSVRTAAADSLIYLKVPPEVLNRIGKEFLTQKPSLYPAIRVLGRLKEQRFNKKIEAILKNSNDNDLTRRAINALGSNKYKNAASSIAKNSNNISPKIRHAVAYAMGQFSLKNYFPVLVKLSNDKDKIVSFEAIKSMGLIKDSFFITKIMNLLKNVKIPPTSRSCAAWSLAQINQPTSAQIYLLTRNIMKKIIPTPMGPPDYDSYISRISCCLTLIKFAKTDQKTKKIITNILEELQKTTDQQGVEFLSNKTLQEYARQANLYLQGKSIKKMPLPTSTPIRTVNPYIKK